jgi:uncharacterized protein
MLHTALWRRLDVPGHDAARIAATGDGWRLEGTAVFAHASQPACLHYALALDAGWATRSAQVQGFVGEKMVAHDIRRTANGWVHNGQPVRGLDHAVDVDLGFTPATNMPQLRRVALAVGQKAEFSVAWLDVDASELVDLLQRYERRSAHEYWYESPSADYEAMLEIAGNGFAAHYPTLWRFEALK